MGNFSQSVMPTESRSSMIEVPGRRGLGAGGANKPGGRKRRGTVNIV